MMNGVIKKGKTLRNHEMVPNSFFWLTSALLIIQFSASER